MEWTVSVCTILLVSVSSVSLSITGSGVLPDSTKLLASASTVSLSLIDCIAGLRPTVRLGHSRRSGLSIPEGDFSP